MSALFNTGDYSLIPHIQHIARDYSRLLERAVERRRYWDAAYIDGYRNAYVTLLLEQDGVSSVPLFEEFDPDDFPSEVEESEDQDRCQDEDSPSAEQNPREGEDPGEQATVQSGEGLQAADESAAESAEGDWLPMIYSESEILEILSDLEEDDYPKLFDEARRIADVPQGYVPQHNVFLDGVTDPHPPPRLDKARRS